MAQKKFDYGKQVAELERIVDALQEPAVQLDEAVALHAAGVTVIKELEKYLQEVDLVVRKHVAGSA